MSQKRKRLSGPAKLTIVKRYLVDRVPISDPSDEHGLQPSQIYRWQAAIFEHGADVFDIKKGRHSKAAESVKDARITKLEAVRPKDCFGRTVWVSSWLLLPSSTVVTGSLTESATRSPATSTASGSALAAPRSRPRPTSKASSTSRRMACSTGLRLSCHRSNTPAGFRAALEPDLGSGADRKAAGAKSSATARVGGISFVHRFGSALNRHGHLHACVTNGVFVEGTPDGSNDNCGVTFLPARPITPADLEALTWRVRRRHRYLDQKAAADMLAWAHSGLSVDASVRIRPPRPRCAELHPKPRTPRAVLRPDRVRARTPQHC